jgi:nucleoside-diphosphate-sugar epimerase
VVEVTNRGTALVTGIRGFTGEYVASELRRNGYQVFGTCLREDDADEFVSVIDLRDRNSVLGYINKLKPKIVIAENVKGLVMGKAKGYVKQINQHFQDADYNVQLFLSRLVFF